MARLGEGTEKGLEKYLFKRFARLVAVRRFAISWVALIIVLMVGIAAQNFALSGYYQTVKAVPGGIYNEGVLGRFANANPLYAATDADNSVSRLLFAGLLKYDSSGQLRGDLASSYSVDARGATYTVKLKPNLTWQDGQPLTSQDVLFTFKTIQNPDAQSPLLGSWRDITITATDASTIVFALPDPLAAFPDNLTTGIVPQHVLEKTPAADLRSSDFNTVKPVGAGPFAMQAVEVSGGDERTMQTQIALVPFADYNAGKPKLQEIIIHAYANQEQLQQALLDGKLTGAQGLDEVSPAVKKKESIVTHNLLLRAATMVFFKTTSGVLADQSVRKALVQAADTPSIINQLGYPTQAVREPILSGQVGYDASFRQPGFDLNAAKQSLEATGWKVGKDGYRSKDNMPLTFTLTSADTPEYRMVTSALQKQWKALGVKMQVQLQSSADFQTSLTYHGYEAVLYGIGIGSDPDVFVYWDSSQADVRSSNRLNFSEYNSKTADSALEAGRTRLDPGLRAVKYKPFLQAWQQDAPALGLYQPRVLYLTSLPVDGLKESTVNKATDRFANVENWQIRQARVTNQ